jgi:hypothetical protein
MNHADLHRAWVHQAHLDAEQGIIECRMCKRRVGLDQAVTLWRNGALVFAVCDRCAAGHDIVMRPTEAGIEIRGRARLPIVLAGGAES